MNLVDNVNSVFKHAGRIGYLVPDISDIIYAVVGRCVHFKHVGSRALIYGTAGCALAAWASILGILAIDYLGKYLCTGGLSRSS